MAWWYAPDVSAWRVVEQEPRGLRAKAWVLDETGQRWLRKGHRSSRPYEPTIEALTLELASRCRFDVAYGRACSWTDPLGAELRGFVSRKFHDDSESQHTGGELVQSVLDVPFDTSSEKQAARPHVTIDVVRQVLDAQGQRYAADLTAPFLRMLVFDAWIGNGDRHSGNWAVLIRGSSARLAPMYDTAGCLGAELLDDKVSKRLGTIERYVQGCLSGFGDGSSITGIPQAELLVRLALWPEWHGVASPLITYISDNLNMVDDVVSEIPDTWLTPPRKELARALLGARAKMLQRVL